MGDRGNIVVKHGSSQVWLYTHWSGSEIDETVKSALRQRQRWNDPSYLARIVFNELQGDDRGTAGFGISDRIGDNEHPIMVVDCFTQKVYTVLERELDKEGRIPFETPSKSGVPFSEFCGEVSANEAQKP